VHRLDSRAPFVLDTRDLGRRAGAMREQSFTAPAPSNLGLAVIGVPEASPIELNVRLEAVVDGVLVSGTASVELAGECVRCLEPVTSAMDVTFQELYVYPEDHANRHHRGEHPAEDDEDETLRLEGDLLDLEPVVRDAVVLALPFQPVCRNDCPGLCSECGASLADDPDHEHAAADPRWAALNSLLDPNVIEKEES
jgi:uncharacterized protein